VDLKFTYHLDESTVAYLHYNLSALELDKVGVEFRDLSIPPFTSGWPGWTYNLFVGQRRQYFGIEPQTDSEDIYFPNRAMMYGGTTPFGNALHKTADPFDFYAGGSLAINNLVPQLVYDKVLGVHFFHKHDFGFLAYSLGVDLVNDEAEASFDGGGTDSLKTGFAFQVMDQDLSEVGRLELEPRALNDLLPWGLGFKGGFSAFHDPENTAYLASQASTQNWADTVGWDGRLTSSRDVLEVQSEWVRRQQFGPSFTGTVANNSYGGLAGSSEGWYVTVALQPWRLIDPKAPKVELLARYDTIAVLDQAPWLQAALTGPGGYTGSYNATTVALKVSYKGNCHTGIFFTTYGLNNDFSAAGPTQLIQLEQQVYYSASSPTRAAKEEGQPCGAGLLLLWGACSAPAAAGRLQVLGPLFVIALPAILYGPAHAAPGIPPAALALGHALPVGRVQPGAMHVPRHHQAEEGRDDADPRAHGQGHDHQGAQQGCAQPQGGAIGQHQPGAAQGQDHPANRSRHRHVAAGAEVQLGLAGRGGVGGCGLGIALLRWHGVPPSLDRQ
jgi:hypothetical protein